MMSWRQGKSTVVALMGMLMILLYGNVLAQELIISGSIVDAKSNKAISGVSIKAKGVQAGGFSDGKGVFRVRVPNASAVTLVFNYIGYKPLELKFTENKTDVVVKIEEDVLKTSEVVVTGIASSIKKANSPNSIGTINEKELLPAPAQTIDQAFAGKFAGISIRQNTGAPGGGMSVTLRGATTLIGGS